MRIRRCAALLIEPRETLEFELSDLLTGGSGLVPKLQWFALAPHLGGELAIDQAMCLALGGIGETTWVDAGELRERHGAQCIDSLLALGLLLADDQPDGEAAERDARLRAGYWRPLSAVAHAFSRWDGVDAREASRLTGMATLREMVEKLGTPPPHAPSRVPPEQRIALERAEATPLDELMAQRVTCRNYDTARALDGERFARILHRTFGAQAVLDVAPDTAVLKKTSPSGGGLHPTEAYLLVQHVEGVAPGLYHYHAGEHALEPLAAGSERDLAERALDFVAGQDWFSNAHVLVVLATRFRRSFWKYRNHAKAYRALILDAGHLSQTLYLSATEAGLGAFITSAINEAAIERDLGLDPLEEGPLAVCGFGWRGAERETVEFDPLNAVWPKAAG